jgi:sulfoacetaldehyde dehydrogenase
MNCQAYVAGLIARSKKAQEIAAGYDQEKVETLIAAISYGVMEEGFRRKISEMLVEEAGMGNVESKMAKMYNKAKQFYFEMKGEKSCGLIEVNEKTGMSKYYKPMGVIAALIPITNSEITQFGKAAACLKGRNSIILAPHPRGKLTTLAVTEKLREILKMFDAPEDLIITVDPECVSMECSGELMKQADFVLATGGTPMVRAAYSSGTPTIGVGTGNTTTFVDGSTDLDDVADMISRSKSFDNATSCSTENNIIVLESVHDEFVEALKRHGCYFVPEGSQEKELLKKALWPEWPANHALSRHIVAQSADRIAEIAGLAAPKGAIFIATEENGGTGDAYPFSGEKLSPVTCVFTVKDFAAALDKMEAILNYMGLGHSCGIHTTDNEKVAILAERMKVTKICVNQPQSLSNGGCWWNYFPKSTTLGCGTWGGGSVSHNVTWKDLVNTTMVSRAVPAYEPSNEDLFPEEVRKVFDKKY